MIPLLAAIWVSLVPLQSARQELAVASANGKVYAIGGISGTSVLASVEQYDPIANRWQFVAPLPEPLHHSAAAAIGDILYVMGGYRTLNFDPTSVVYRYDPRIDVWSRVASLPSPRGAAAAAAIDGRIYVAGGSPGADVLTAYDPLTDRWTTLMPMPTAREHLAAVGAGGKLYVAGGRTSRNINALEMYDPISNLWTPLAPLPTARSGIAAAVIDNRIYVFGGEGNPSSSTGVFEQSELYDIATDTWRTDTPMTIPRHGIGAAVVEGRIYIPGGAIVQGFGAVNVNDALIVNAPPRRRAVRAMAR
ncbi:MAG TPA: kelch repeat-containing protein [Thermoanaerobaculia bacterium]|nr:kelch repeat-containing protein [Thermoanaerobaculia bacterium]